MFCVSSTCGNFQKTLKLSKMCNFVSVKHKCSMRKFSEKSKVSFWHLVQPYDLIPQNNWIRGCSVRGGGEGVFWNPGHLEGNLTKFWALKLKSGILGVLAPQAKILGDLAFKFIGKTRKTNENTVQRRCAAQNSPNLLDSVSTVSVHDASLIRPPRGWRHKAGRWGLGSSGAAGKNLEDLERLGDEIQQNWAFLEPKSAPEWILAAEFPNLDILSF